MFIPKSLTQREKVLYALREAGKNGLHSFDIIRIISHKAPARISELRKDGFNIISIIERKGESVGVRYFLKEK